MGETDGMLWATAYHEAGHCVVGLVAGWRPSRASIVAGDNYEGATLFDDDEEVEILFAVDGPPRDAAERYIIRCFAGPIAEHRHAGDDADLGECDDYAKAAALLIRLSADRDRLNDALVARTNAILDEHWPAVERVAASLVKHLTIDEQTIRSAARVKGVAASS